MTFTENLTHMRRIYLRFRCCCHICNFKILHEDIAVQPREVIFLATFYFAIEEHVYQYKRIVIIGVRSSLVERNTLNLKLYLANIMAVAMKTPWFWVRT